MKRFFKTMILSMAISTITVLPCFAQELTKVSPDVTEEQFLAENDTHNKAVASQLNAFVATQVDPVIAQNHVNVVVNQLKNYNRASADNYINYRKQRVIGFKETERIKKEIVDNYVWLSQYNPYFMTLIPNAVADYDEAVKIRESEEIAVVKITNDFNVLFPR